MCNDNRGALMQDDHAFDGAPQLNRRVVNDARGYVAELAAKAVDQASLAQPVGTEDKERLRAFLRNFGALDQDLAYHGSARAGWATPPDATQAGTPYQPLDLRQILASDFWRGPMQFGELSTMAATMLQPVGGMGRIGQAFGHALRGVITYEAVVTQLRRTESGRADRLEARRGPAPNTGSTRRSSIVTIPFPALSDVDADFAPATREAMASVEYVPAGKVAFQASRRFWELDQQIYGGISWTSRDATQVWYPSGGLQQTKGILVGAYIWSDKLGNGIRGQAAPATAERHAGRCRASASRGAALAGAGRVGGVEEHSVHARRLGGMEQGSARNAVSGAAEGRRAVSVRRRTHVVHHRLAGRRGALGAQGAGGHRRTDALTPHTAHRARPAPAALTRRPIS